MSHIVVTGGAGFIGANFVLDWLQQPGAAAVVNVDKLTYAGSLNFQAAIRAKSRHVFIQADICDRSAMDEILREYRPVAVVHFAAESHVDRSIQSPQAFVETNVVGTFTLLDAVLDYWRGLPDRDRAQFRFLQVSTDEVFGSLAPHAVPCTEAAPYAPGNPYSATKAAADHLVQAYHQTYGLPVLTARCTNNYGPFQFPEKLIPVTIQNALAGVEIPLYGDGLNVREWIYVGDHCAALRTILARGEVGETYNIGGEAKTNLAVVTAICELLDQRRPKPVGSYQEQIRFVTDRPGHDRRYAVDSGKLESTLGWTRRETFSAGLGKTVQWYLDNLSPAGGVMSEAAPGRASH